MDGVWPLCFGGAWKLSGHEETGKTHKMDDCRVLKIVGKEKCRNYWSGKDNFQWQVFSFFLFWGCRELTHPSLSATCCFSSHLISRAPFVDCDSCSSSSISESWEFCFPFFFSISIFIFFWPVFLDRTQWWMGRSTTDGHRSIFFVFQLFTFIFSLGSISGCCCWVIAWISPAHLHVAIVESRGSMSVGWAGICYSRRVSLTNNIWLLCCCCYRVLRWAKGNQKEEKKKRKRTCRSIDVSPDITSSGDYAEGRHWWQAAVPSIHPSILPPVSSSVCPRCWGGGNDETDKSSSRTKMDRPFFLFFFFSFSYSVVTEFHHHPSPPGRKSLVSCFAAFLNFKKKNVDRRKMSLRINGRWLLAWFAPPTSQKEEEEEMAEALTCQRRPWFIDGKRKKKEEELLFKSSSSSSKRRRRRWKSTTA